MCEEYLKSTHTMVLTSGGEPYVENNLLLLRNNKDGNFVNAELTDELCKEFNIEIVDAPSAMEISKLSTGQTTECKDDQFTWAEKNTLLLLEEYKARKTEFRNPKLKKKTLWCEISKAMQKYGYLVTVDILDKKFRNMKSRYLVIKDNNKKKTTGTGRISWPYYDIMSEIFAEDKTVNPSVLISSLNDEVPTMEKESAATVQQDDEHSQSVMEQSTSEPQFKPEHGKDAKGGLKRKFSSSSRLIRKKSLDLYRKEIVQIEAEKIEQLKTLNLTLKEYNVIQREKLNVLKEMASALKAKLSTD